MKVLTWNIRHGGNKRLSHITETLVAHDPDVLILTEFREGPAGVFIKQRPADAGWAHMYTSNLAQK